jgi:hypothetical protein
MVTFTEHVSRYTVLDFLTAKSDVPKSLKKYVERAETHHQLKVSYIRSDNGEEYTSAALQSYFEEKGITHQRTAPYMPQQNGTAEPVNQTILQIARTLLKHAGLPDRYWPDEAAPYVAYIKYRLYAKPSSSLINLARALLIVPCPSSFKAALQDTDSEQWLAAIELETEAMRQHKVFEFVPDGSVDPKSVLMMPALRLA